METSDSTYINRSVFNSKQVNGTAKDKVRFWKRSFTFSIDLPRFLRPWKQTQGKFTKVAWAVVYIACTILCALQLIERINLYLQYRFSVHISVLRGKEMAFPSIVLCYLNQPFKNNVSLLLPRAFTTPCDAWSFQCNYRQVELKEIRFSSDYELRYSFESEEEERGNKTITELREEMIRDQLSLVKVRIIS